METVTRKWSDISRKVIYAVAGAIVAGTATVSGMDQVILWFWSVFKAVFPALPDMPATVATLIGAVMGAAIGGWLPKERLAPTAMLKPESGSVLRSPPVATGLAILLMLAALGTFLAGCASASVGSGATLQQRVDAARTDLATAGVFVDIYAAFPRCGASVRQPCSNANLVALLVKGRAAAAAAVDVADALIGEGAPEARILTALIEAHRAIVVMENLRANGVAPG